MDARAARSPVLESIRPVIERSRHVQTSQEEIERVARWMAYEEFRMPEQALQFDLGDDPDRVTDAVLWLAALDFAFTDFTTRKRFDTTHQGQTWADAEALFACLHRALESGWDVLDGAWMAAAGRDEVDRLFDGTIEIPMLDERVEVLREIGAVLVDRYDGRFHRWATTCAPAMYAGGDGLLERMVVEFRRFDDVSPYAGHVVRFHKLAQLGLWQLHLTRRRFGHVVIRDLELMTAFADYIVPVALRVMGITTYTADLARRIDAGELIERNSEEEVELRAHSLHATARLTEAINAIRPPDLALVIPQVDYRLWKTYHATFHPHHLTRTIMY